MANEPVLKVTDYNVEFWVDGVWYPAAIDMNYEVAAGEVLAIVGESGSGKSSSQMGLMSLLATNARVTGSVKVRGQEMIGVPESQVRKFRGKEVAYIFQEPMTALNPVYTIGFQIVEALQTHLPMSKKQARDKAIELLTLVEIPEPEKSHRARCDGAGGNSRLDEKPKGQAQLRGCADHSRYGSGCRSGRPHPGYEGRLHRRAGIFRSDI